MQDRNVQDTGRRPASIAEVRAAMTAPGQLFEMAEARIRGVRTRVWKNAPATLRDVLEISRLHGDKDFLVYGDDRLTFAEHHARAAAFARRLVERYGIAKGDRVAIAMRNYPEWSVAFFGAAVAGAVVVPLNAWWSAGELEYGLADSGAKVLVADAERAQRLAGVLPGLGVACLVARAGGAAPAGTEVFEDVIGDPTSASASEESPPEVPLPDVPLDPEDEATIFYTSGTTGRPKGALGTHRNIAGNPVSLAYGIMSAGVRAGRTVEELAAPQPRVTLLSVPFFHATGCHSVLVSSALQGGTVVLMYKWDVRTALELIEREGVTGFGGVPTMAWQVLTSPDFGEFDTSSLTGVSYGGAPAAPALVDKIKERLPERMPGNGYGLTETSSVTTYNGGVNYLERPESVGPPVAVCDVRVVGPAGEELPTGEVGELLIKGPNVIKGYWNKPDATAAAFVDGWFHSGDLARLDADGFVYIVDRAKDMLIRGGENIYCAEVESALYEHPAVADCAVIGVPHQVLGEEVGAVVVPRPGAAVSGRELREFLAGRIAAFKVPAHVWFREQGLPRNPGGKILKTRLREELLDRPPVS
ncbi:class I adenylate-forming enzyme family protein [Actinomadura citrea]|uniref:Long-chain acyl-CoA synthetase n=1 Tax=Actinomadura citrea TaxID=46158 RepID=A0A7Y9GCQ5_9ACTN|nr:AMP-binding protein [Actinomadura citrea]NYE14127.1 long-chain acyl-CoA synthetase [Actinomadura citrea]GGU02336.1 fatty acid--CoA ligase [Actinomadura citrea]